MLTSITVDIVAARSMQWPEPGLSTGSHVEWKEGLPPPPTPRGVRPRLEGKPRTPLSSRVATRVSWSPLSGLKGQKCSFLGFSPCRGVWGSSGREVHAGLPLLALGTVTEACVVSGAVLLVIL